MILQHRVIGTGNRSVARNQHGHQYLHKDALELKHVVRQSERVVWVRSRELRGR